MHSVHGRKCSGPSIHRSQSRPWGVTFHARCRASRLLSLQIPKGIITGQPMVRATIQMTRMVTGHRTAAMIQVLWLPWIMEDVYEFRWGWQLLSVSWLET